MKVYKNPCFDMIHTVLIVLAAKGNLVGGGDTEVGLLTTCSFQCCNNTIWAAIQYPGSDSKTQADHCGNMS